MPVTVLCIAAVSKAFSTLSDGNQRAAYDRYGDQEGTGLSGQRRAGPTGTGFGGDGFDAEEIFNMFFNGGFGGGNRYNMSTHVAIGTRPSLKHAMVVIPIHCLLACLLISLQ